MIIIYGGVAVDPTQLASVTEAAQSFVAASRAEAGCVDYILSWDLVESNRIRLIETWADQETATAHTLQKHTAQWTSVIGAAAIEAPVFHKHEAAPAA
ncbi:putative quinol monooxygenase [Subtercola frigoramans]|uniref:Quinol monooxygenase YgiN n=1 Tax=Subtercola frigoramans TaxID=120298 RepID=A0ABS2L7E2_9MICO|nr:putative quinol monooxygenase [Subtercola frigoramans]MBM7473018.1 quinol monooxygenase YgiN [Subtercola frigoramans]